ncbi:EGF domain-specific O-linked N-acetylglucosamine transferase [Aplysia californica]|uniref:EGF domain-specific O-linked N-acetylglucosamine transferase n=1 Tax=Aplysia californica TaxID=6500 RepID=A0ABM0JAP0_APLCA|nr:EGF domain-specific O-linked N-acetylglucosamine transferase [Aplysia californica]XP_005089309.1 EGF domain-specific O-linked N-acetylglucosamine transferase [Aplysia californica]XP_005089310.1 EGF domain-specific O-linked N-acetylglucosamine transferase [Aplysia californica]XP_035824506.1 EGF domain-specific O-linked N-acetylglucosamine transferase [Aplysia californica]
MMTCGLVLFILLHHVGVCISFPDLNLPELHVPFFFNNNPDVKAACEKDVSCPYKAAMDSPACWGYETACSTKNRLSNPDCSGDSKSWAQRKQEQLDKFWRRADFGLVSEHRSEMKVLCKPNSELDSSLECAKYLRYCKAKNIFFDFSSANIVKGPERNRYREDVLKEGQVGGHCTLDVKALKAEGEHKSPLQSWFAELEHYTSLPFQPSDASNCDIVFDKPTYLIKLDAGINMYHHFCDFVNLYASQHINNSFSTDVNIIMWDTSPMPYGDFFSLTWKAFSDYPVIPLKDLDGKKVCFKEAVFPLLARMRFGLYYNMPLMPGCYGSSLIQAFSQHILHRLDVPQEGPLENRIRITLLNRNSKYRNILNREELASALKTDGEFEVTVVEYNRQMPFYDQLVVSHNSDILIGMHGAGLTHMLFQPDWAVVMELYNCEDAGCYFDLARLRGIRYMTWERKDKLVQEDEGHHPTLGAHAKFTNYSFDLSEFMRLIYQAAKHVRNHPAFLKARRDRYPPSTDSVSDTENPKVEL